MDKMHSSLEPAALAIELDGCTFTYKGADVPALRGVTLKIPRGQCVVVTGQSGCGKTTLTRLVNALIPVMYEGELEGDVRVMGTPVPAWTMDALSARVGSVFQNPRSQFVNLDVTSEIAFGCESLGIAREEIVARVEHSAAVLDIAHLLGRGIEALSGGQRQSVILASVYAVGPDIFVLDEPTASLDVHAMRQLARTVALLKGQGKTVLISEHRLWWLEGIADRYVMLEDGALKGDWTAAEFAAIPFDRRSSWGLRAASLAEIDAQIAVGKRSAGDGAGADAPGTRGSNEGADAGACDLRGTVDAAGGTGAGAIVRAEGVVAGYRSAPAVLDRLDFSLMAGRVVGIVGRNGAGKTTLGRCMAGLLKEKTGMVEVAGEPMRAKKRAGRVYLVMQEPGYQLFSSTVDGELAHAYSARRGLGTNAGGPQPQDSDANGAEAIAHIKRALGLEGLADRHPLSLSGGERQRLSIAAGLLSRARAMVLDEPTSGLDYRNMRRIDEQITRMRNAGMGICIVSHDYEFLCSVCDEIAVLEKGRIADRFALNKATLPRLKGNFGFAELQ